MTREHKLALILAFSVLLVVGLLVGDHFSKARKPQGAGVVDVAQATGTSSPGLGIIDPTAIQEPARTAIAPTTPVGPGTSLTVGDTRGGATVENTIQMGSARPPQQAPAADPTIEALRRRLEAVSSGTSAGTPPGLTTIDPPVTGPSRSEPTTITPPPASTNPLGLPVSTEKEKMHPVAEGETLYGIAKAAYGDGALWEKLAKYNASRVKGSSVRVGVTLRIPPKDVLLGKAVLATDQNQNTRPVPAGTQSRPVSAPTTGTPTRITSGEVSPPTRPAIGMPLVQDEPATSPAPRTTPAARPKTYTVKAGDTLGKIAGEVLGSSKKWEQLLDANSDQIESPEELKVGMVLKVPAK